MVSHYQEACPKPGTGVPNMAGSLWPPGTLKQPPTPQTDGAALQTGDACVLGEYC